MSEVLDYEPLRTRQRDSRKRLFREECLRELMTCEGDRTKIAAIAQRVVGMAVEGDMRAVEFLADRIDGKVPQAIVGDVDNPLFVPVLNVIERTDDRLGTAPKAVNGSKLNGH